MALKPALGVLAVLLAGAALFASAALFAGGALAQQSPMPEEIEWKLQELGSVVDPPRTAAIYATLQQKEPYPDVRVERDVAYGPDALNRIDIFTPESTSAAKPVLMFVHEGAFIGGDKHMAGSPFLDNIMLWAVKNGFVGVNVNYRLAPPSVWPSGPEDIAAAVQWVSENIQVRGGDPSRIYLMGHSAGAVHVASYVSHPEFYKVKDGGLAGAILVSGIYQLGPNPEGVYFGADTSRYPEQSSLQGLLKTTTPLMIVSAELDPPRFIEQFNLLKAETCKLAKGCAHAIALPQHSHMSEVYSINTPDTRLTDAILDFVKTTK